MIKAIDIVNALAIKLKSIHPDRRVFFNDLNHLDSDSTSIEFVTARNKKSGQGEVLSSITLDLVCFFKDSTTTKALELSDEITANLGSILNVGDRRISFDYETEFTLVDDTPHYILKLDYRYKLENYEELCEMDLDLFNKIGNVTGETPNLETLNEININPNEILINKIELN